MASAANASLWRLTAKNADVIVPLGGRAGGCPFYCVHSISGEAHTLQSLAQELAPDRPVFAFQIPAHRMTDEFGDSVESIAARYVDQLVSREPDSRFYLGGWSAGSFIALEMAQILKQRGRATPLVVALDGFQYKLKSASRQPNYLWNFCQNLPYWLGALADDPRKRSLLQRVRKRIGRVRIRWPSSSCTTEQLSNVEEFLDTSIWPDAQASFVRRLFDVVEKYEAKPYDGALLVFAAKAQHLFRAGQVEFTWRQICQTAELIKAEGTHVTMLQEPRVAALAKNLRARLAEFDRRATQTVLQPALNVTGTPNHLIPQT